MNRKIFLDTLQGVPPSKVEVRYKPDDDEAYMLGMVIVQLLGHGKDGLGWDVSGPSPITEGIWGTKPENVPLTI
jgi:hypothetical protein